MRRRLPPMKAREVIAILERARWHVVYVPGSHFIMRHSDKSGRVPVPFHADRDVKIGGASVDNQAGWDDCRGIP